MPNINSQRTTVSLTIWLLLLLGQCFYNVGECQTSNLASPFENVVPFTLETNFMSQVGFYRWQYYQRTGRWPVFAEEDSSGEWGYGTPQLILRLTEMMNQNPGARILLIYWGHEYITSELGPGSIQGEDRYYPSAGVLYRNDRPIKRISPQRMHQLALRWKELWPGKPVPKTETEAEIRTRLEMYQKARRQWLTEWDK